MKNNDFIEIIPLDEQPNTSEILTKALNENLEYVLVIGQSENGWYYAASDPDPMRALFSANQFRQFMMGG